jgi:hypothetical protein
MIGKLVKSTSSMRWIEFMVKYESGTKFFGLLKKYKYAYIHPYIPYLPDNLKDYKIGDLVRFQFMGELHIILLERLNNNS